MAWDLASLTEGASVDFGSIFELVGPEELSAVARRMDADHALFPVLLRT